MNTMNLQETDRNHHHHQQDDSSCNSERMEMYDLTELQQQQSDEIMNKSSNILALATTGAEEEALLSVAGIPLNKQNAAADTNVEDDPVTQKGKKSKDRKKRAPSKAASFDGSGVGTPLPANSHENSPKKKQTKKDRKNGEEYEDEKTPSPPSGSQSSSCSSLNGKKKLEKKVKKKRTSANDLGAVLEGDAADSGSSAASSPKAAAGIDHVHETRTKKKKNQSKNSSSSEAAASVDLSPSKKKKNSKKKGKAKNSEGHDSASSMDFSHEPGESSSSSSRGDDVQLPSMPELENVVSSSKNATDAKATSTEISKQLATSKSNGSPLPPPPPPRRKQQQQQQQPRQDERGMQENYKISKKDNTGAEPLSSLHDDTNGELPPPPLLRQREIRSVSHVGAVAVPGVNDTVHVNSDDPPNNSNVIATATVTTAAASHAHCGSSSIHDDIETGTLTATAISTQELEMEVRQRIIQEAVQAVVLQEGHDNDKETAPDHDSLLSLSSNTDKKRSKMFLLCGILCVLVLMAGAAGAAGAAIAMRDDPPPPAEADTTGNDFLRTRRPDQPLLDADTMFQYLVERSFDNGAALNETSSPQRKYDAHAEDGDKSTIFLFVFSLSHCFFFISLFPQARHSMNSPSIHYLGTVVNVLSMYTF
jgi:hypothetical protein